MPRRKKSTDDTPSLLDITAKLRSGACVPALREAVKSWQAAGRNGLTDTTRTLLNYWFEAGHTTRTGLAFRYHEFQREAIETLIYAWEVEKFVRAKTCSSATRRTPKTCICRRKTASPATAPRWLPVAVRPR